jgi:predicted ATPase
MTVKNYKSLHDLTIELKPLMVFIGPNNAGKSNLFDCLRFVSDIVTTEHAARQRGGFEQMVFDGNLHHTISIELQGVVSVKNIEHPCVYLLELQGDRYGSCFINREQLTLIRQRGRRNQVLLEYTKESGTATAWDEGGNETGSLRGGQAERSYLYAFRDPDQYPILGHVANEIQQWTFFNFMPSLMRDSLPVRKDLRLQSFGQNLAVVLHTLQAEYPQQFRAVEDMLQSAVSDVAELTTGLTAHEVGQTYVRVREKALQAVIPAWSMSDGTLRFLGHLAVLCSPTPPPLICFEEPENYLHPRLLALLVELLKNAAEKTQVFVTTHSPYLVDCLRPEDLCIVEKHEGRTQAMPVGEKGEMKKALKTLGLGELWYSGHLGGVP